MAWCSMSPLGTSTGPLWVIPRGMMARSLRSDLNSKNMITIVPFGGTFTPKLQLEKRSGKLYWSDREGMRVMRANQAGSEIETLGDTSLGRFAAGIGSEEMVCRHCGRYFQRDY